MVSSCLCGEPCKYSGLDNYNQKVMESLKRQCILKVCPEVFGGLSTPRKPAEIVGGSAKDVLTGKAKILTQDRQDVTDAFLKGANMILKLAQHNGVTEAILKANSPSCGVGMVYDGHFCGRLIEGNGILAELLLQHGITVKTEKMI